MAHGRPEGSSLSSLIVVLAFLDMLMTGIEQHDKAHMAFQLDRIGGGSVYIPSSVDGSVLRYRRHYCIADLL